MATKNESGTLEPGDILLGHRRAHTGPSDWLTASVIEKVQGTPYGHAAMYVGGGQVVHAHRALPKAGVTTFPLKEFKELYDYKAYRVKADPEVRKDAVRFVRSALGKGFSLTDLVGSLVARKASGDETKKRMEARLKPEFICSTLIAAAYPSHVFAKQSLESTKPVDLAKSNHTKLVAEFKKMANTLPTVGTTEEVPQQPTVAGRLLPAAAAVTAGGLAYGTLRRPTFSRVKSLRDIQRVGAEHGLHRVVANNRPGVLQQVVDRVRYDAPVSYWNDPKTVVPGVAHHWGDSRHVLKGKVDVGIGGKYVENLGKKINEYRYFNKHAPGSMSPSESLADTLKELKIPRRHLSDPTKSEAALSRVQEHLRTKYPQGFLMKENVGAQSSGMFPQEHHDFNELLNEYRSSGTKETVRAAGSNNGTDYKKLRQLPGYSGRVLDMAAKNPASVMVQQKAPLARSTGLRAALPNLLGNAPTKEVRVHVRGGVALPGMSVSRYDPLMHVLDRDKLQGATDFAQGVINKLPKSHKTRPFNMDVAPLEGGGYTLIESNPGGSSGLLLPEADPLAGFKLHKALTGKWSPTVAGAGALAAGGATYGATKAAPYVANAAQQVMQPDETKVAMKTVDFQGMKIRLDRPKGFVQTGKSKTGKPWARTYLFDYGFIPKTKGGDGDGVDVFIGPDKNDQESYWAIQKKDDGSFDEYKVFLGFGSKAAAKKAYTDHIPAKYLKGMVTVRTNMMKAMLGLEPAEKLAALQTLELLERAHAA